MKVPGLLLVLTLAACEPPELFIPLNQEGEKVVFAYSILYPDSSLYLAIDHNHNEAPAYGFPAALFPQIKAELTQGAELFPFTLIRKNEFVWHRSGVRQFEVKRPQSLAHGATFTLSVGVPGFPLMSASTVVKNDAGARLVLWDSVGVPVPRAYPNQEDGLPERRLIVEVDDPAGNDYYLIQFTDVWYGSLNWETTRFAIDLPFNMAWVYTSEYMTGTIDNKTYIYERFGFSDKVLKAGKNEINIRIVPQESFRMPDIIWVFKIGKEYYEFLAASSLNQNLSVVPFAEPVQVPTNFDNGAGVFSWAIPILAEPLTNAGKDFLEGQRKSR